MARTKNAPKNNVVRHKRAINRKTKINIVFDHEARKEFLTGFHKRKLYRQKKAQEELAEQIKAEKKRIKDEARNLHKTLVVSHRPIPELEELLKEEEEETFEFDEHNVSVKEISTAALAEENCWIGANKTQYESDNKSDDEEETKEEVKLHTGKEIKKAVRQLATKQMKKSKIFQKKGKVEQKRSRKSSGRKKKKGAMTKRDKHNNAKKIKRN